MTAIRAIHRPGAVRFSRNKDRFELFHIRCPMVQVKRETRYALDGQVQVDDAYLGGERSGGKVGRARRTSSRSSQPSP